MRPPIALALLAGCAGHDAPPTKPISNLADAVRAASRRMHQRFDAALDMEDAVATGDLSRAVVDARRIDELDEPDFLAEWKPHVEAVREAAHRVGRAASLDAAAEQVPAVATACADCHVAIRATIRFPVLPAPAAGTLEEDMRRHHWAGLQMWEGLIGPDDHLWEAGARDLAAMPASQLAHALDVDDVTRVRQDAGVALATQSREERAALFGRILAACAHCHGALRVR